MAELQRATLSSAISYRDPKAAYVWLEKAFGFEPMMVLLDADGNLIHSQMSFGAGVIMVGSEWSDDQKSPASVGGKNTQTVHVHLEEDVGAHCERARAAGAQIIAEPSTQFYGDRTYRARDLEGHIWTFGQAVAVTTPEDWAKVIPGISTVTRL
jgi:uncharacterized glyoxalase superfamily protein PhnB